MRARAREKELEKVKKREKELVSQRGPQEGGGER